jgi:hypothetical protein
MANHRLLNARAQLSDQDYRATRTSNAPRSAVSPPQLDEFFVAQDAPLRARVGNRRSIAGAGALRR